MDAPAVTPELVAALKRLKLGPIAATLPDRLVLADKQDMSFDELLLLVLSDEGTLALVEATAEEYREKGRAQVLDGIDQRTWPSPRAFHFVSPLAASTHLKVFSSKP